MVQDDKLSLLAQLFWIAICLMESDYEHEFLLALRLLERVLHRLPLDRPDCRDRVCNTYVIAFKCKLIEILLCLGGEDASTAQME